APGSTLTNYNPVTRTLSGGRFLVDGSGRISGGIEFDGADIATLDAGIDLLGAGAGIFNSSAGGADALANLDTIANAGQFPIAFDPNFEPIHDFTVAPTGALTVSDTTSFSVAPGFGLTNFNHAGTPGLFEDGNFNIQGTLIADNAHVILLNNTTVL